MQYRLPILHCYVYITMHGEMHQPEKSKILNSKKKLHPKKKLKKIFINKQS